MRRLTLMNETRINAVSKVCLCNRSWGGCHAQLLTETTVCLKCIWCLLVSKNDVGIFGQYFWIS